MDEYVGPVVHQDLPEPESGGFGFFGDLGGVDDDLGGALEEDVDEPPPEQRGRTYGVANATAADLEALELEPEARQETEKVPVAALFGDVPGRAAPAQQMAHMPPPHTAPGPPGLHRNPHAAPPPGLPGTTMQHVPGSSSPAAGMHLQAAAQSQHMFRPHTMSPQPPPHAHAHYAPQHMSPQQYAVSAQWSGPPGLNPPRTPQSMAHAPPMDARMMPMRPVPGPSGWSQSPAPQSPAAAMRPHAPNMSPHQMPHHTGNLQSIPPQALFQSPQAMHRAHAMPPPSDPPEPPPPGLPHYRPPHLAPISAPHESRMHAPPSAVGTPVGSVASQHHYPMLPSQRGHMMAAPSTPGSERSAHQPHPPHLPGPPQQRRTSYAGSHAGSHTSMRSMGSRHLMPVLPGLEHWVRDYSCMSMHEVDEYLSFNMRNLHSGELYVDDYYYHAHLNKYYNAQNVAVFRPKELYALAPHEKAATDAPVHARVEGLGKFVFSSLRAPRQLLAVSASRPASATQDNAALFQGDRKKKSNTKAGKSNLSSEAEEDGAAQASQKQDGGVKQQNGSAKGSVGLPPTANASTAAASVVADSDGEGDELILEELRPPASEVGTTAGGAARGQLQSSIQAGARRMIEDCNCYILDIDDIDRANAAEAASSKGGTAGGGKAAQGGSVAEYRDQRRRMLMENVANTIGGRVFAHIIAHPKGRRAVGNILKRIYPPNIGAPAPGSQCAPQGMPVMHLVLRHADTLFQKNVWPAPVPGVISDPLAHKLEATVAIAVSALSAISQIKRAEDVVECLEALSTSDLKGMQPQVLAEVEAGRTVDVQDGSSYLIHFLSLRHNLLADSSPWLGSIVSALLQRAAALKVNSSPSNNNTQSDSGADQSAGVENSILQRFQTAFSAVLGCFMLHLMSIKKIKERIEGNTDDLNLLMQLLPQDLTDSVSALCSPAQHALLALHLQQVAAN